MKRLLLLPVFAILVYAHMIQAIINFLAQRSDETGHF